MWACDPVLAAEVVNSYYAAGPLFTRALQSFLAAQCALVGDHLWPADATEAVLKDPNYDFIVVGAGSAGSVVANRLSEVSDWKVLLVEAGGNPTLGTETPQLFYSNMNTPQDWNYITQPDERACRSYIHKGCAWPRGKTLGGCSSINGMFYVRGNKADYDEWAAAGNPGWGYDDVLPFFKKSENLSYPITDDTLKYHGIKGFLNVEGCKGLHQFEQIIVNASTELGVNFNNDVNGASQMGQTCSFATLKDGIRQSTARAFLSPVIDRKNLHVLKNAQVTKLLFERNTNKIRGIAVHKQEMDIIVNVKKEIILSAGAINTPHLLLLSGIGPQKQLEDLEIEVKADLPVGENLQDHLFVPTYYALPGDKNILSLSNIIDTFAEYILHQTGPFASTSPHKIIAFYNTTDVKADTPDVQFHYVVLPPAFENLIDIYHNHYLSTEFREKFIDLNKENFILKIYTVLLRPKSKGKIILRSKNPFDYPLIYPKYFESSEDMKTILRALKEYTLKLNATKAIKDTGFKLTWIEIDACKDYVKESDEFLECMARELTFSLYHPTSTVKMGPDDDNAAVVTSNLKVRKVIGLRVIDASIMPEIVRGNTNAPTIMIAEKGADMIKKEWLNIHNEL